MSEKMYPIPFASLMNWVVTEYAQSGDIFGVHKKYEATGKSLPIFGERIETPFGLSVCLSTASAATEKAALPVLWVKEATFDTVLSL